MRHNKLAIFSVFHKAYPQPNSDFITPIQVGKAISGDDLGFLGDHTGENISAKNPTFCELTALYWIWKNSDQIESEFIGLSHYRRYFCRPEQIKKKKLFFSVNRPNRRDVYIKPLTQEELDKVGSAQLKDEFLLHLNDNKIIIARESPVGGANHYNFTIKDSYIYNHIKEDWLLLEAAMDKIHPDYTDFAKSYFDSAKEMHCFNMFIGSKIFLKDYCEWLFPILTELENTVRLSEYPYQRRLFGFMAERLFNLYIKKNSFETVTYPVVFFD